MRKIAILYLGRRGAGPIYAYEMARALSKENNIFAVLSSYTENKSAWDSEVQINKNLSIKYVNTYTSMPSFLLSSLNLFRFIEIIRSINLYSPDIFYSPMEHFWDAVIYPFVRCKLKIKTIHDVKLHKQEDSFAYRFFHWFTFRQADKYVILSKKFTQNLINKGIKKQNIIHIPHANFSYYSNEKENRDFYFNNKILFFGRILEYKGLHVLLKAMKIVVKNMPNIKLVIAGDGNISPYKNDIDILHDNIELHNEWISIEDVKIYFKDIDVVVLPYIQASQSGVIPLAYSFSKPVIVSNTGALDEQMYDGKTGYLIEPHNHKMLAERILYLMSSPDMIYRMSKECYKVYKNELTWEASAKKFMESLCNWEDL
ncbi:MAG: glycosyltransferase family 4 protein [Campylobacteraceae bacterium]|jgi:glycosyltransferase involved in cell wall biosynthesis|nr:glycosyltransferase family 4 protein [Campylobacteraceae bacterium]